MEKVVEFLKDVCMEKNYPIFFHEKTREIWISGYRENKKFDIFIKLLKDGSYKFIYEIPEERKVALFSNEDKLLNRLNKIFHREVVENRWKWMLVL